MTVAVQSARRGQFAKRSAVGGIILNKNNNSDETGKTNRQYRMYAPPVDSMMREVLHTLGNIDFQHDAELDQLEQSRTDEELKNYIRGKLLARHRERREPYVELLTELRKHQHRLAFVA
jgi:hypothetical protein